MGVGGAPQCSSFDLRGKALVAWREANGLRPTPQPSAQAQQQEDPGSLNGANGPSVQAIARTQEEEPAKKAP
jgi:hypothetical protein